MLAHPPPPRPPPPGRPPRHTRTGRNRPRPPGDTTETVSAQPGSRRTPTTIKTMTTTRLSPPATPTPASPAAPDLYAIMVIPAPDGTDVDHGDTLRMRFRLIGIHVAPGQLSKLCLLHDSPHRLL